MKLKLISTFHLPALSHSISFCLAIPLALSHSPSILFSPILSPIPSPPFFLANPLFLSYFLCLPLFFLSYSLALPLFWSTFLSFPSLPSIFLLTLSLFLTKPLSFSLVFFPFLSLLLSCPSLSC